MLLALPPAGTATHGALLLAGSATHGAHGGVKAHLRSIYAGGGASATTLDAVMLDAERETVETAGDAGHAARSRSLLDAFPCAAREKIARHVTLHRRALRHFFDRSIHSGPEVDFLAQAVLPLSDVHRGGLMATFSAWAPTHASRSAHALDL